jgi:hypothetical protein
MVKKGETVLVEWRFGRSGAEGSPGAWHGEQPFWELYHWGAPNNNRMGWASNRNSFPFTCPV